MLLIQLTGLSGAGKSTLAFAAKAYLIALGYKVEVIDGDEYRKNICSDLGFSEADRNENIRRLGFIGLTLAKQGIISILSAINPYESARIALQNKGPFVKTVYLSCPIETLKTNDVKGLYKRALLPLDHPDYLEHFTGISDPYEAPKAADMVLHTHQETVGDSLQKLITFILLQINNDLAPDKVFVEPAVGPRALFIGRWQPFHNGHKWLIDKKLKQGIPVLIAVRDIPRDHQNPFTTTQTMEMIQRVYFGQPVKIIAIPDIESFNCGRGVGYEVNCFSPPSDIKSISATFIRDCIRNKNDAWKDFVSEAIHENIRICLSDYDSRH